MLLGLWTLASESGFGVGICFCPTVEFSVVDISGWVEGLMGVILGIYIAFLISWWFGVFIV